MRLLLGHKILRPRLGQRIEPTTTTCAKIKPSNKAVELTKWCYYMRLLYQKRINALSASWMCLVLDPETSCYARLLRLPPTETIALKWYLFHLLKLLNLKGLLKKSRYVLNYFQRSKMCLGINWILNIWSRFVAWISDDYFESFSPLSNVVTEGLKTSLCNRLKIRLPDLLSKIIFRHWNCYLSSFATDGKDEHGLKNQKFGPTFSSFDAMVAKRSSQNFYYA